MGTVKVLPDTELADVFQGTRPHIQCKLCCVEDNDEDLKVAMNREGRIISCVKMSPKSKVIYFLKTCTNIMCCFFIRHTC